MSLVAEGVDGGSMIQKVQEHNALRDVVRGWVARHCPPSVVRSEIEEASDLSRLWAELLGMEWLGLHVGEEYGGSGYGVSELGVVIGELGVGLVPGPFLPTTFVSLVLQAFGSEAQRVSILPPLVNGERTAGTAVWDVDVVGREVEGGLLISGSARPVLGSAGAWLVLAPVRTEGAVVWCLIDDCQLSLKESLDLTRRAVVAEMRDVLVPKGYVLEGVETARLEELFGLLSAAESCGGARWCLDTAVQYAQVREQFGRPIGQFQAIKHKCTDMLVALEQAEAVTWDAMRCLDDEVGTPEERSLTQKAAAAMASETFLTCANECIQVLGGMGFTWEHDAHLYLRRAMVTSQLLGSKSRAMEEIATAALENGGRQLSVALPEEAEAGRLAVRRFAESVLDLGSDEQRRRMASEGYIAPHWPKPWGRDAGPLEQVVIDEEFERAGIARPHLAVGAWALPTLIKHGTSEQQERWVSPTLEGELNWCQLFSEPGAGSDLASLATKATAVDEGWVVNGQKVWTSMVDEADLGILLARTDPSAPKHEGISFFVLDMESEGIDVRPLRDMAGGTHFTEIFLNDVVIPGDCLVGDVNCGWGIARTTLENERVSMAGIASMGRGLERLVDLIARCEALEPSVLVELGELVAEAQSLAVLQLRSTMEILAGGDGGAGASVRKLLGGEHEQRVQECGLRVLGPKGGIAEDVDGGEDSGVWQWGFLFNRCLTIAGGTSEVQRNLIAERVLGLPRDTK